MTMVIEYGQQNSSVTHGQEIIAIILFIMTKGLENYFILSKIWTWKSEKIANKEVIKSTHRKNQYTITFV
jgi:hypothetical protein